MKLQITYKALSAMLAVALLGVAAKFVLSGFAQVAHYGKEQTDHHARQEAKQGKELPAAEAISDGVHAEHMQQAPDKFAAGSIYYCPMHPSYKSDKPGECPICHMTLVALEKEKATSSTVPGYAVVNLSAERRQLIGVRSATVEKKPVFRTIRTAGLVEFNEKTLSTVNLKLNGWVEELVVKATGDRVKKGAPLFFLYSPELLEAKKSYLLALQARRALPPNMGKEGIAFAEQALKSARDRLLLWDITPEQIRELEAKKEPEARTAVVSKVDGIVTKRKVVEGSYVQAGADLYEIADLSSVWVYGEIFASEMSLVSLGQQAEVSLASRPNETFCAIVSYIYPYLERETHTVRVRMEVNNSKGKIKPGDYAVVSLQIPLGSQLVIDDQAIMNTGERQIAFVDLGAGRLEPRTVKIGTHSGAVVTITEGLHEGEKVVTSANFLVDSESRLKAALMQGSAGEHRH